MSRSHSFTHSSSPSLLPSAENRSISLSVGSRAASRSWSKAVALPFVHHTSYRGDLPQVYQDLLGVSAMYCQRTSASKQLVFTLLDKSLPNLFRAHPTWPLRNSCLPHKLLRFIRSFDCSMTIYVSASTPRGSFQSSKIVPLDFKRYLLLIRLVFCRNKSTYDHWIAIESARRTVLVSVMLQAIYALLNNGACSTVPFMATLPVSTNSRLWGLTEDDWWQATSGAETELVTYREYVSKWKQWRFASNRCLRDNSLGCLHA